MFEFDHLSLNNVGANVWFNFFNGFGNLDTIAPPDLLFDQCWLETGGGIDET